MTTALYRRYRPETFADVIGQEHVTDPLMAAIDKDRINHAYLFSGPRGCGKTTSARILARCLNCAQGPTSTPCGTCNSCVELARGGSGSLDVIEIDAASHGGVDDARDLRERATFAPVRDRFKIFIIDEAHMVTSAGFNALLKIVEEPPEHILFIFATTEPDKVIGTIRSRTHHYPFRLVPPEPLAAYLDQLCQRENVPVAPGVLSLVIRAGGGSVRDSLSVLDQLMAGAGDNGLDYELAVSLLGYTHATLLDDVVDSIAAGDSTTVFNAVDRVIQTGHDPRRFVEDLLERFRDLIVINAVPEGAASILRGVPDDQLGRMRTQATQLGAGELSRAADVTNTALTDMTGATSPRLHLELLCARLLLPAADATARGTLARVDRIERRLEYAGGTAPTEQAAPDGEATVAPRATGAPSAPRGRSASSHASAPEEAADPGASGAPGPGAGQEIAPPAETDASDGEAVPDPHAAPARPRLDVPWTAEEAAARWSLPAADPEGPAVPAAVQGTSSPAASAAPRDQPAADGGSSDWGATWGVSNTAAFAEPDVPPGRDAAPAGRTSTNAASSNGTSPSTAPAQGARTGDNPPDGTPAGASGRDHAGTASRPGDQNQTPAVRQASREDPASQQPENARPDVDQRQAPDQSAASGAPPEGTRPAGLRPAEGRAGSPQAAGGTIEMVRRAWPEIMDEVAQIKRATWLIVNVSAKPRSFDGNQLVLAFVNQGNAIGFQRGPHVDNVKQAIHKVLGLTCSIEAIHDAGGSGESGPKVPGSESTPGSDPGPVPVAPSNAHPIPPAGTAARSAGTDRQTSETPAPAAPRAPLKAATSNSAPSNSAPSNSAPSNSAPTVSRADRSQETGAAPVSRPSPQSSPRGMAAEPPASRPAPDRGQVRPAVDTKAGQVAGSDAPDAVTPEATGAWDPSMSDDSWALVEPPEDAFDPGPGRGPAAENHTRNAPGAPGARPVPEADQPERSRSVVWSPDPVPASRRSGQPAGSPTSLSNGSSEAARAVDDAAGSPERPERPGSMERPEDSASPKDAASPSEAARADVPAKRGPMIPSFVREAVETERSESAQPSQPSSRGSSRTDSASTTARDRTPSHAEADGALQKPVSRYQQLLDEAERTRAKETAAQRGAVDLRFVEDEPSADDETLEESQLVGRTAIERILNGRLVEERPLNGQ